MSEEFSLNEKIYRHLLLLQAHDEFMDDVLVLRKKIEETTEVEEVDDGNWFTFSYEDTPEYDIEIKKLMEKYQLSNIYNLSLRYFIAHDFLIEFHKIDRQRHIIPRLIPQIEDPIFYTSEETGEEEVHYPDNYNEDQFVAIELFPETTVKDIINNWNAISKERDRLYGIKNRSMERTMRGDNLERDLEILKHKKQGETGTKIVSAINSDDRFNGRHVTYGEIPRILKRLKERVAKIIPSKET